jgi:hypothetical protein
MSERVMSCGHGHDSIPSSRMQLPSMKLQHRFRTRFLALTACFGVIRMMLFNAFLLSVCDKYVVVSNDLSGDYENRIAVDAGWWDHSHHRL